MMLDLNACQRYNSSYCLVKESEYGQAQLPCDFFRTITGVMTDTAVLLEKNTAVSINR